MAAHAWLFYAVFSAAMWGLGYVLSEKVMKAGIHGTFLILIYALACAPVFFALAYFGNHFKSGVEIVTSNKIVLLQFIVLVICFILGNYFIFKSISLKNVALVNLIEISYPFFTVLFSWVLFKEFQLTPATILGAVLIFCGVSLIYLKS